MACQAERRLLARTRRETSLVPPVRRNRVWQFDFSGFETASETTWRTGGVADYWAEKALGCRAATTQTAPDMILAFEAAIERAEALINGPLAADSVGPDTGEIEVLNMPTTTAPPCDPQRWPTGSPPAHGCGTSVPGTRPQRPTG